MSKPEKSEILPPWWDNRTVEEITELINKSINFEALGCIWRNPKFEVRQVGEIYPPQTWFPSEIMPIKNDGGFLIKLSYDEIDSDDMKTETRFSTREWWLEANVADDNIERTVYKLLINSMMHRLGEFYLWNGCRIHTPHKSLDDLIYESNEKHSERLEYRLRETQRMLKYQKEFEQEIKELEARRDALNSEVCNVAPEGWKCSRKAGHEGPCAAIKDR